MVSPCLVLLPNEAIISTLIGMYIEKLKKANSEGFEEKIIALTKADKNQFEKIIFELDIAYQILIANHKVNFIKTKREEQETTPDLLVDDSI